jgi:hypothetical protein
MSLETVPTSSIASFGANRIRNGTWQPIASAVTANQDTTAQCARMNGNTSASAAFADDVAYLMEPQRRVARGAGEASETGRE